MNIDIKQMSLEQLKALCYDQLVSIEQSQNNLKLLNQEIGIRNQVPTEVKELEKSDK